MSNIATIRKGIRQPTRVLQVIFRGILLSRENVVRHIHPVPCPVVVGPTQAEWKVRTTGRKHRIKWALEKPTTSAQPVVVITEAFDAVRACQLRLGFPRLWHS